MRSSSQLSVKLNACKQFFDQLFFSFLSFFFDLQVFLVIDLLTCLSFGRVCLVVTNLFFEFFSAFVCIDDVVPLDEERDLGFISWGFYSF